MNPTACATCGDPAGGAELCPPCAGLLRWVRGHFEGTHLAKYVLPDARLFDELDRESLDYMDWLLEAEEKLNIDIDDHRSREVETVGEFVRMLKEAGARWPDDRDIRFVRGPRWFSPGHWEVFERPAPDPDRPE